MGSPSSEARPGRDRAAGAAPRDRAEGQCLWAWPPRMYTVHSARDVVLLRASGGPGTLFRTSARASPVDQLRVGGHPTRAAVLSIVAAEHQNDASIIDDGAGAWLALR